VILRAGANVDPVAKPNSASRSFVPLPKSATPARIQSNAQLYDFSLDASDMKALDDLDRGKGGGISWNPVDAD
jgi:diketogulonate reductase-like aldo/keto reductase